VGSFVSFFFQAEDGIRDDLVTGVQTCALPIYGATSVTEIQKRVKEYAAAHPKEPWILGMGWSYPTFSPSGLPDKKVLDEVVPDRSEERRVGKECRCRG